MSRHSISPFQLKSIQQLLNLFLTHFSAVAGVAELGQRRRLHDTYEKTTLGARSMNSESKGNASLPKNWRRRSDWKVLDLMDATNNVKSGKSKFQ